MKRVGSSLIEMLVGIAVASVVFAGVFSVFLAMHRAESFSVTMPGLQQDAQRMAMIVAGSLRRSVLCTALDTGYTPNAAVADPTPTSLTVFTRPSGILTPISYAVVNGVFERTVGGTTTELVSGATMNLTYYASATYHSTALVAFTPDSTTTPTIVAVQVTTTATSGSASATYSTLVRLRNGPLKNDLTD